MKSIWPGRVLKPLTPAANVVAACADDDQACRLERAADSSSSVRLSIVPRPLQMEMESVLVVVATPQAAGDAPKCSPAYHHERRVSSWSSKAVTALVLAS